MNPLGPWTTADFDHLSWHDVHIHGFKFENFDDVTGSSDLIFDIDFILNWQKSGDAFDFTVCQAILRFHQVFGFRITLDYKAAGAGMCPFSLDGIEREVVDLVTGHQYSRWNLPITWPKGEIRFDSPGFTQSLIGTPHVQSQQFLAPHIRQTA